MELYKKIYIKSEADLPKEEDVYYVHIKPDNKIKEWFFHIETDHREWLKYIDWYLQPVEAEAEKDLQKSKLIEVMEADERDGLYKAEVSDENDFVQYVTNLLYSAYDDGKQHISSDVFDEWIEKEMENMSEFYASHNLLASKVTDADIEKWAKSLTKNQRSQNGIIKGAKAFRDGLIKKG